MDKCVVRRSVVLPDVNGYGCVIEDSILGPNISLEKDLKQTLISPEGETTF